MNSAEVLPPEDHAEFERVLEEALRTIRLTTRADQYHVEQLRSLALKELPRIVSSSEPEYRNYARLREELRRPDPPADRRIAAGAQAPGVGTGRTTSGGGTGLVAVAAALVPVLAAIAAVIFLLLGYALGLADPEPAMARPMREVGWVFAVLAAAGLLLAAAGLLVAAVRNGAQTSIRATGTRRGRTGERQPLGDEVVRARDAWRRALLDQGIMPFLREQAARSGMGQEDERRTPRLRFSSPDFSSPDFAGPASATNQPSARPRFSQPNFSGPEFGRPHFTSPEEGWDEELEAAHGERRYGQPHFSAPDFASPDFESPDAGGADFAGPAFDSPDFDGPEFTSPDFDSGVDDADEGFDLFDTLDEADQHGGTSQPSRLGEKRRRRPGYGQPDFSSPEFTSPADGAERD
ncbi:hypothetical protein [Streptomyces sp. B6B3]|uniref:hypothetical protein n=1 Tax=Streptomyces sp. B6B3 TaxID=3153570 RepID=UPI00325F2645